MTMLSFRIGDAVARAAQVWADRLGVDRSELLREALRRHLLRLASEDDARTWETIRWTRASVHWPTWRTGGLPRTGRTGPMQRGEV